MCNEERGGEVIYSNAYNLYMYVHVNIRHTRLVDHMVVMPTTCIIRMYVHVNIRHTHVWWTTW